MLVLAETIIISINTTLNIHFDLLYNTIIYILEYLLCNFINFIIYTFCLYINHFYGFK